MEGECNCEGLPSPRRTCRVHAGVSLPHGGGSLAKVENPMGLESEVCARRAKGKRRQVTRGRFDGSHPLCLSQSQPAHGLLHAMEEYGWSPLVSLISGRLSHVARPCWPWEWWALWPV